MKTWIISFHPPCIRPCSHSECTWSDTQLHTEKKLLKKKRPWGEGIWRTGELSIKFHRWPFPSGKVICSCPVTQPSHRQDFSHRHQHFPKRCSSGQEKNEHPKRRFAGHFKAWEPRKPTGCCQTRDAGADVPCSKPTSSTFTRAWIHRCSHHTDRQRDQSHLCRWPITPRNQQGGVPYL